MGSRWKHLGVDIDRSPTDVYAFVADPLNLPQWAAGLAGATVEYDGEQWSTESPMGPVRFSFVPRNEFGVLDHDVTLPSGATMNNPLRVMKDGDGCVVVFSLRQRRGMTDEEFERDADAVARDLDALKSRLEAS